MEGGGARFPAGVRRDGRRRQQTASSRRQPTVYAGPGYANREGMRNCDRRLMFDSAKWQSMMLWQRTTDRVNVSQNLYTTSTASGSTSRYQYANPVSPPGLQPPPAQSAPGRIGDGPGQRRTIPPTRPSSYTESGRLAHHGLRVTWSSRTSSSRTWTQRRRANPAGGDGHAVLDRGSNLGTSLRGKEGVTMTWYQGCGAEFVFTVPIWSCAASTAGDVLSSCSRSAHARNNIRRPRRRGRVSPFSRIAPSTGPATGGSLPVWLSGASKDDSMRGGFPVSPRRDLFSRPAWRSGPRRVPPLPGIAVLLSAVQDSSNITAGSPWCDFGPRGQLRRRPARSRCVPGDRRRSEHGFRWVSCLRMVGVLPTAVRQPSRHVDPVLDQSRQRFT